MNIMTAKSLALTREHGVLLRTAENEPCGDVQNPSDVGVYPRKEKRRSWVSQRDSRRAIGPVIVGSITLEQAAKPLELERHFLQCLFREAERIEWFAEGIVTLTRGGDGNRCQLINGIDLRQLQLGCGVGHACSSAAETQDRWKEHRKEVEAGCVESAHRITPWRSDSSQASQMEPHVPMTFKSVDSHSVNEYEQV